MTLELKAGQKNFNGVLVNFEDVQGKRKSDNKEFHFLKFSIDFTLSKKDGGSYSKIVEFMVDPEKYAGKTFIKYQPVVVILEIMDPIHTPTLVDIIQTNNA